MKRIVLGALAGVLAAAPTFAQPAPPALTGPWLFHTYAQVNAAPVCSEVWTFGPGGEMSVESGQERTRSRFRVETDRDGAWLVTEQVETNRKPDCMGAVSKGVKPGEQRTYLVPMNDGGIETCPAPSHTQGGAPFVAGCFGRIFLADKAG